MSVAGSSPKTVKKVEFDTEVREMSGVGRRLSVASTSLKHNSSCDKEENQVDLCIEHEPGTSDL